LVSCPTQTSSTFCLFTGPSVCPSLSASNGFVCQSLCSSVHPYILPSVCPSICLSAVSQSVCLSVCLFHPSVISIIIVMSWAYGKGWPLTPQIITRAHHASTLLHPAGGSPLKWLFNHLRGGSPSLRVACSCLMPAWTPHAIRLCPQFHHVYLLVHCDLVFLIFFRARSKFFVCLTESDKDSSRPDKIT
jgi:hypothetical protein